MLKPNHIRISNLTELGHDEECMIIRIEMDGCSVGSVEPGEHFDIRLPHDTKLTVRESISCITRVPNTPLTTTHAFTPLFRHSTVCRLCGNGLNVAFHTGTVICKTCGESFDAGGKGHYCPGLKSK